MTDEQSGTHAEGQGVQVGDSGTQHNNWGPSAAVTVNVVGENKPPRPRSGGHRNLGTRRAAWWAAVAVIAAASCLVAAYFAVWRPHVPLVTAQAVGNSELFSDPQAQGELARMGDAINSAASLSSQGSWDICNDAVGSLRNYDFADVGDTVQAQCVFDKMNGAGYRPYQFTFHEDPLVIVTHSQTEKQLEQLGVVYEESGIYIFNVARYLRMSQHAPPHFPQLTMTYPENSNSGDMFAASEYMALNGGVIGEPGGDSSGVIDEPFADAWRGVIQRAFHPEDTHTPQLMTDFLSDSGVQMAVVYESDYLYDATAPPGNYDAIPPAGGVVAMYPNPDIISRNTLVSWDSAGDKLLEAFQTSGMENLAEYKGYRADDDEDFVRVMAGLGRQVPSLSQPPAGLQFVNAGRINTNNGNTQQLLQALADWVTR